MTAGREISRTDAAPGLANFAALNRGHALYAKLCAQSHDAMGARTLTVIPAAGMADKANLLALLLTF